MDDRISELGPESANSQLISLLAGNLRVETGSILTASSATDFDSAAVVRPALGSVFGARSEADLTSFRNSIRGAFAGWRGAGVGAGDGGGTGGLR